MCSIVPPKNPVATVEHEEVSSNPPVTATSSLSPVSPEHEGLDRFHDCDDSHGKNLPVRKRKKGGIEGSASPSPDQSEDVGGYLKRVRQGDKDSKTVISNIKTEDPKGASRQSKTSVPDVVPWCPTTESGDSPIGSENEDLKPLKRPPMSKAREIRLEQNRKAARESRRRKKVMIEELQRSVIFFSRANGTLKQQNEELSRMLMQAQSQIVAMESGRSGNPQQNQGNNLSNQHTQQGEGSSGKAAEDSQQQEQASSNAAQESSAQQSQDTKKNDNLKDSSQQQAQAQAQLQISLAQQAQAQAAAAQAMYGAHSFPPAAARTGAQTYAPAGGVPGAAPSPMASGITGTPTPNMQQAMMSFQQAAAMQAAMQAMGMSPGPAAATGGAPSPSPGTGAAGAAPGPAANTQQPNPQQAFQEMLSSFAFQQAQIAAFMQQQQQQQQQQNPHMGAMQAAMAAGFNPAAAFSANPGSFAGFAAANPMAAASWQNGAAAAAAQQTSNTQNQQTDRS